MSDSPSPAPQANDKENETDLWVTAAVVAVVLLFLLFAAGLVNFHLLWDKSESAGHFGDSFGFLNSAISLLALCGVVVAILYQRQELKVQQEDLRLTRDELQKSADAHQQLVRLSALSTLLQTYLQEYQINQQYQDALYERCLREDPEAARVSVRFRILTLRAEIENIHAATSGLESGVHVVTLEVERVKLWLSDLRTGLQTYTKRLTHLKRNPSQGVPDDLRDATRDFLNRIRELEAWLSVVPPDLQNSIQLLRHRVTEFSASAPLPGGGPIRNSAGIEVPPGVPLYLVEQAEMLALQADELVKSVQSKFRIHAGI